MLYAPALLFILHTSCVMSTSGVPAKRTHGVPYRRCIEQQCCQCGRSAEADGCCAPHGIARRFDFKGALSCCSPALQLIQVPGPDSSPSYEVSACPLLNSHAHSLNVLHYLTHLAGMHWRKWKTLILPGRMVVIMVTVIMSIAPAEQLRKAHRMNANLIPANMRTRQHGCARGVNYR